MTKCSTYAKVAVIMSISHEKLFQIHICESLASEGWIWTAPADLPTARNSVGELKPTDAKLYDKEFALIPEDLFGFIEETQNAEYVKLFKPTLTTVEVDRIKKDFLKQLTKRMDKSFRYGGGLLNAISQEFSYSFGGENVRFKLLEFAPESGLNKNLVDRYGKNRYRIVHELTYSVHKADRIDLVPFVNGFPIFTFELKSGRNDTYEHAIAQYKSSRTPWVEDSSKRKSARGTEPLLNGKRAVAHFAMDTTDAYMATKLNGKDTFFLPFNAGGDPDNVARNKVNGSYKTSYIWEDVLHRHTLLNILRSFVNQTYKEVKLPSGKVKTEDVTTFPRFHQWFGATLAMAVTLREGTGKSSLMMWSAGSGKSNGIAWLAHGLNGLHYESIPYALDNLSPLMKAETLKFAPVVLHKHTSGKMFAGGGFVITDRTNLDTQLSGTVAQKNAVTGTVVHINGKRGSLPKNADGSTPSSSKSAHLKAELALAGSSIKTITQQTFPSALAAMEEGLAVSRAAGVSRPTANPTYFVLRDEAHSSEGGKGTQALLELLNAPMYSEAMTYAEKETLRLQIVGGGISESDAADVLIDKVILSKQASRADRGAITYFAFTATPKPETLKMYGRLNPDKRVVINQTADEAAVEGDANNKIPLHTYSMEQAIAEEYILDVLANYTTYDLVFKLATKTAAAGEELVDATEGRRAIMDWALHQPETMGEKVKIIVEHFKRKAFGSLLNEKAQGMVFTSSRVDALLYKRAIDAEILKRGFKIKTLVAFSGEVEDPETGQLYTESQANGFEKPRDVAVAFEKGSEAKDGNKPYHILIVARKYQTGYDNPRLVAGYIDKSLSGIEAVQALSRLNRIAPELAKKQVTILDFVNDYEDMLAEFSRYYKTLELEDKSNPNFLHEVQSRIDSYGLFTAEDVRCWVSAYSLVDNVGMDRITSKIKGYFETLKEKAILAEDWASVKNYNEFVLLLKKYVQVYGFQSTMIDFKASLMEKKAIFYSELYTVLSGLVSLSLRDEDNLSLDGLGIISTSLRAQKHEDGIYSPVDTINVHEIEEVIAGSPESPEKVHLQTLVDYINDIFGGLQGVTEIDANTIAEHFINKLMGNEMFASKARTNTFEAVYGSSELHGVFNGVVTEAYGAYEKMITEVYKSPEKQESLRQHVLQVAWDQINGKYKAFLK